MIDRSGGSIRGDESCSDRFTFQSTLELRSRLHIQKLTFFERCSEEAERLRKEAEKLPHGPERDELESKAHQAETAADMELWLRSRELKSPK